MCVYTLYIYSVYLNNFYSNIKGPLFRCLANINDIQETYEHMIKLLTKSHTFLILDSIKFL